MSRSVFYALAALLALAVLPMPIGYYSFVRLSAFVFFGFLAWMAYVRDERNMACALTAAALLFNPIFSIVLPKLWWSILDLGAALALVYLARRYARES